MAITSLFMLARRVARTGAGVLDSPFQTNTWHACHYLTQFIKLYSHLRTTDALTTYIVPKVLEGCGCRRRVGRSVQEKETVAANPSRNQRGSRRQYLAKQVTIGLCCDIVRPLCDRLPLRHLFPKQSPVGSQHAESDALLGAPLFV